MSEQRLRNLYLPPFKAAIDAGADTVMCSFNAINGVPGCANKYTETDILKKEWGFDGFIESDYTAVAETRACPPVQPDTGPAGTAPPPTAPQAGANALMAGTDSEMVSTYIRDYGRSCSRSTGSRWPASTTPYAGSCASSSAPASSTTRTSTRRRPPTRPASSRPRTAQRPARRPASRWCC